MLACADGLIDPEARDERLPRSHLTRQTSPQAGPHSRDTSAAWRSTAADALVVLTVAVSLRVLHVWQMQASPFASILMGDSVAYDEWARRIAAGDWLGTAVFYQAPLYPYALGTVYLLVGRHLLFVRLLQAVVGGVACAVLTVGVDRAFRARAGLWAGMILALYGEAIFLEGLIQKSVLDSLLVCALILQILLVQHTPRWTRVGVLGLIVALLCLTRENALLWIAVLSVWIVWFHPKSARANMLAFVLAVMAVLGPVALRNHHVGGGWALTTAQSGPNLYIGNSDTATGTYVPLRRQHANAAFEQHDARQLAEAAVGHSLGPGDVSAYWRGRALGWIESHPAPALRLFGFKLWLLMNHAEAADTEDSATHAQWSWIVDATRHISFGWLLPLAVFGLSITRRRWRELWVFYALTGTYAVSVAVFYVLDRYRHPLVPFLSLFAGLGVSRARPWWRQSTAAEKGMVIMVTALVAVVAAWPEPLLAEPTMEATTAFNLAVALQERGDTEAAIAEYRAALRLLPGFAEAHSNLGTVLASKGDHPGALAEYQEALRLDPDLPVALNNVGLELAAAGQYSEAIRALRVALDHDPQSVEAHYNLGLALAATGQPTEAMTEFRTTLQLAPTNAPAHNNIGILLASAGDVAGAIAEFREALRLQPGYAEAKANLEHAQSLSKVVR